MNIKLLLSIVLSTLQHHAFSQHFSPNNLILLRHNIGGSGGTKDPNNNGPKGMAIYLDEYDFSHPETPKFIQSFQLPSKAQKNMGAITLSGISDLENYMTRSSNKRFLVIPGYGVSEGINVYRQPSVNVPRTVALIDASKNINLTTFIKNAFSSVSFRSAAAISGSEIWYSGETISGYSSGPYYSKLGAEKAINIGANIPGSRSIRFFDNKLYVSLKGGISQIGHSIPVNNDTLSTISLNHLHPDDSPKDAFDFFIADVAPQRPGTKKVMYVMDNANGVRKYSFNGSLWIANGTINVPNSKAVEGKVEANGDVTLYIVSHTANPLNGDSKIFMVVDNSGFMRPINGEPKLLLNTSGSNKQYRSIAFSPITNL